MGTWYIIASPFCLCAAYRSTGSADYGPGYMKNELRLIYYEKWYDIPNENMDISTHI